MIRIALVGCGGMGGILGGASKHLADRLTIAATVDIDADAAQLAAERLGADKWETDYRCVLDDVDALVVSLPHRLHHPVAMEALAAGKHVLMEKPLAISEAQCLELIDKAQSTGRVLMVAYPMPYNPLYAEMGRLIKQKTYGDAFQVSIWTEQRTQGDPDWWVHKREHVGGGQLFSHGCHYIDLLLDWLGQPIEGTHMGTQFGTPWLDFEGTSNACIRFASGAVGYHMGTWGARGTRLGYAVHAHCTEGMIELNRYAGKLILHTGAKEGRDNHHEQVLMEASSDKYVQGEIGHFIDCIETGKRPLTDGRRALQSLRVVWRVYDAEQRGTVADLRGLGFDSV